MVKNRSKRSISDAMKIYNGCNPVTQTISAWSINTFTFLLGYTILRIVAAITARGIIGPDEDEVTRSISRISFTQMMCFVSMIGTLAFQMQEHYMQSAGAKYFRSVTGGFDTYSKMKKGQLLQCILGQALFAGMILLLNAVFHLVSDGPGVCVTVYLISLIGTAPGILIWMIKNQAVKYILFLIMISICSTVCATVVYATDGTLSAVHVVFLIIAVLLIPAAHLIYLKHFRKKYWYN